ncbi:GNAT family N-acetyltransferase [Caulobacter sp. KR2-114]|uniref:GNAT family N-acetyltransferase n=1 Tax=Caulobacter sp. KR2-114 TaxID=3400912 RepID=UPI003C11AFDC
MSLAFRRFAPADLPGVIALCAAEGWPSFPEDPGRALRALTAPGVTTVVAAAPDGRVAGFAQLLSDGEIQAHLSLIAVDPDFRRQGVARGLLDLGLRLAGGVRIDLVTDSAPDFYLALRHRRFEGFRLYPPFQDAE